MAKKHWFLPKMFGWGFMPASIEGWLMTLALIIVALGSVYSHGFFDPELVYLNAKDVVGLIVELVVIISVFSLIAIKKTKGEVKWNWGFRKKK